MRRDIYDVYYTVVFSIIYRGNVRARLFYSFGKKINVYAFWYSTEPRF